jgi:hypothetical protein
LGLHQESVPAAAHVLVPVNQAEGLVPESAGILAIVETGR